MSVAACAHPHHPGWRTRCNSEGRDVGGHHAVGAYDRAISDANVRKDDGAKSNKHIIAYLYERVFVRDR
jgi:hypothetical protein